MNLIGKIFIVAIFIMSLVFMSLSLMVYATQRNWYLVAENPTPSLEHPWGLRHQLADAKNRYDELQVEQENLRTTLQTERAARQQALAVLESTAARLQKELNTKDETLATLRAQHDAAVTAMDLAGTNLSKLGEEVQVLRQQIRRTEEDRNAQLGMVVQLQDRLNELQGEQRRLESHNDDLTDQVARQTRVLTRYGLDQYTPLHNVPPKLDGAVTMVRGSDLIELSIGTDDGLRVGHKLDVYRGGGVYLGRVEVLYTRPDEAVAKILPAYRQGIIKIGDLVATRLLDDVRTGNL